MCPQVTAGKLFWAAFLPQPKGGVKYWLRDSSGLQSHVCAPTSPLLALCLWAGVLISPVSIYGDCGLGL